MSIFKQWSLKKKFSAIIITLSISFILSTILSIRSLISLEQTLLDITEKLSERTSTIISVRVTQRNLVFNAYEIILQSDPEVISNLMKQRKELLLKQNEFMEKFKKIADPSEIKSFISYEEKFKFYLVKLDRLDEFIAKNHKAEAWLELQKGKPQLDEAAKILASIIEHVEKETEAKIKDAKFIAKKSITESVIMAILSISLSVIGSIFLLRNILVNISTVLKYLSDNTFNISQASNLFKMTAQKLSESSIRSANSLTQTSSSIEEVSAMISKNNDHATKASVLSSEAKEKTYQGNEAVIVMKKSMLEIHKSNDLVIEEINLSNKEFAKIVTVIQEIGNKTKIINDIVFQTKLLSFNASVEAARAGVHGKGFAVVAEEIGNLAIMSGNAATEISEILTKSIEQVDTTINSTSKKIGTPVEVSKNKINFGSEKAEECEQILKKILEDVETVTTVMNSIANSSIEQKNSMNEISSAINELENTTHETSDSSKKTAVQAEELSQSVESLKKSNYLLMEIVHGT